MRHAIERLTFMRVFRFDGEKVEADDDTWTIDYMRDVSAAYRWEGERLKAGYEALHAETEKLVASGRNTLAEYYAQSKQ